jgi:hypothetical protein
MHLKDKYMFDIALGKRVDKLLPNESPTQTVVYPIEDFIQRYNS